MSAPVQFSTIQTASGFLFGHALLSNPGALNALTLPMIDLLYAQLREWAKNPAIAGVVLTAEGDKAFCAGGDVVGLYHASKRAGVGQVPPEAELFFEHEYRLDYLVHTYEKPILCWAQGIVMGGGVGLMMGASHRVISPNARIAMPEIHIGLYPDVAGTWFLHRMPGLSGLFLALTGAIINAGDALLGKWADAVITHTNYSGVLNAIEKNPHWQGKPDADKAHLTGLLNPFQEQATTPLLVQHAGIIEQAMNHNTLAEIDIALRALQTHTDEWLAKAAHSYVQGSPTSAVLSYELMKRHQNASLAEVFRLEYQAAVGCCANHDFPEGVRALLIDKDKSPQWQAKHVNDVSPSLIENILKPRFTGSHPLADL